MVRARVSAVAQYSRLRRAKPAGRRSRPIAKLQLQPGGKPSKQRSCNARRRRECCATNCLAPVARVLDEAFGLEWGLMSTVHAYTGSQALVDRADKDLRRGRAAALNIVPSSTGAARAIGLVLPHLKGRLDGMSFRVPVPTGSVIDLVFETRAPFTPDSLHGAFDAAERDPSYRGVLTISRFPLVSSDIIGRPQSAIVDATSTIVMGDRRGKVVAFYDNEWGYASRVVDVVRWMGAGRADLR
jgi:glyceraldehyde 3-phosphate dehydrogenase